MGRMKKVLAVLLTTVMSVSFIVGCSNNAGGTTTTEAQKETTAGAESKGTETTAVDSGSGKKVTLKTVSMFGGTDPAVKTYTGIIDQFMTDNPNITISDDSSSSNEEWKAKVASDFAVGNEPDVLQFFTDATANEIIATDKLVTLDEIRAEYPDYAKDSLDDALAMAANSDGVERAVPTTGYWEGLYVNKDIFDEYDLALPTDWDSLVTAIEVLNENGITPIAVSLNEVPHYWVEFLMLYSAGADEFASVPEKAPQSWVKGLEVFKTLRDLGAFPVDTDTIDNAAAEELFNNKKAAMQLDGSWRMGSVPDHENVVVIPFPGVPDQKAEPGTVVGGLSSGFYITKKAWDDADKRDAAVKFVMAQTSKESLETYWSGNGLATVKADPVEGMSALEGSGAEYSNAATKLVTPTDSRINPEAYKLIIANIVKISVGSESAEDILNEALTMNAERQ